MLVELRHLVKGRVRGARQIHWMVRVTRRILQRGLELAVVLGALERRLFVDR